MLEQPRREKGLTSITMQVNGQQARVDVDPFETLAHTLRDRLGLTGTKIGCDAGDCGACTVLMDGKQVCACLVAAGQADGEIIETIERGSGTALLGRLQAAFLAHGAAQCGICTPGMLMAALDLLQANGAPTRLEVEDALGGVLCRCTGYRKIVDAVLSIAGASHHQAIVDEAPEAGGAVGSRVPRMDGPAKISGNDSFGADEAPANALWLRAIRSPHARARFELGDLERFVSDHPGLVKVLSAPDVPGFNGFGIFPDLRDQKVFAEGEVRYRGDVIAALVGERDAVEAVAIDEFPVQWYPLDAIEGIEQAKQAVVPPVHEHLPDNILVTGHVERGDVAGGHKNAAHSVETVFETGFVEHGYIEPEAGYAQLLEGTPDRIEIYGCTQAPYMDREEVAHVLGLDPARVRVRPSACGGGFGGKLDVSMQPLLAVACWVLRRPVRTIFSRIESMAATTKRHPAQIAIKASADKDGKLTAFTSHADFNTGAYSSWGPTVAGRVPIHAGGPYEINHIRNTSCAYHTNANPAGAFRGFGIPQVAMVQELTLDLLADKCAMDRFDFRYLNALRVGGRTATGQQMMQSCGMVDCLDAVRADWTEMIADTASHNDAGGRVRRGAGIAGMWYGCGNTAMTNPSTMRVVLKSDGRITLFNGATDIGQGSATVMVQICADALGLPIALFDQVLADTDLTADAGKTSASRQTFVSGKASFLAGSDLRMKILALANVGEDAAIEIDGAALLIRDGDIVRRIELDTLEARDGIVLEGHGTFDPPTTPLDNKGQGSPYATYGFGVQLCSLDVDMALGTVRLNRIVAAYDVGRAINPTLVEGQIHGGIAQGIGLALMEEFIPGRTENLHDYLMPTVGDVPDIDIRLVEDPEKEGPFGAKGIGEQALIPTAPAILGAIRHASGVMVTRVPVLPHRLLRAIRNQEGAR